MEDNHAREGPAFPRSDRGRRHLGAHQPAASAGIGSWPPHSQSCSKPRRGRREDPGPEGQPLARLRTQREDLRAEDAGRQDQRLPPEHRRRGTVQHRPTPGPVQARHLRQRSQSHQLDSGLLHLYRRPGLLPDETSSSTALSTSTPRRPVRPQPLDHFWRSLANLTINPDQVGEAPHTMSWAVSQAAPLRRVNITGNLDLTGPGGSLAFGSEIADSRITGTVSSGHALAGEPAQAQYYIRNSVIGSWDGTGVNLVFSGVNGAPASGFDPNGYTTLPSTPLSRPAPFLYLEHGKYQVFVPSAATHTARRQLVHRPPGRAEPGNRPVLHRQAHRHRRSDQPSPCRREEPPPDAGRLRPGGTHPGHPTEHRGPGPGLRHLDADPGHSGATDPRRTRSRGSGRVVDAGAIPSETLVRRRPTRPAQGPQRRGQPNHVDGPLRPSRRRHRWCRQHGRDDQQ